MTLSLGLAHTCAPLGKLLIETTPSRARLLIETVLAEWNISSDGKGQANECQQCHQTAGIWSAVGTVRNFPLARSTQMPFTAHQHTSGAGSGLLTHWTRLADRCGGVCRIDNASSSIGSIINSPSAASWRGRRPLVRGAAPVTDRALCSRTFCGIKCVNYSTKDKQTRQLTAPTVKQSTVRRTQCMELQIYWHN